MKFTCGLIFLLALVCTGHSQSGEWTWVKGSSTPNSAGNYGVMGVPSPNNEPPTIYAPAFWTDTAGNFWVYGGITFSNSAAETLEALWKFDPVTLEWTWMSGNQSFDVSPNFDGLSGVFDTLNDPGGIGYGVFTWTDNKNHLWMYGNATATYSNNLWQYDPALNQWAWMNGGQANEQEPIYGTRGVGGGVNTPGARSESNTAWTDSAGNLWLLGGNDVPGALTSFNDMWEYNITTGMWAWMSGDSIAESPGLYGQVGAPSANYCPSSRMSNLYWQDSLGNFWLIGGYDFYKQNFYNDVWKFNPETLQWTLVKGSAAPDTSNIAPANCTADTNNEEGGRYENRATWKICDELIINYGGFQDVFTESTSNDFWAFLPGQNEWIKLNEYPLAGSYGTQNMASAQNCPPVRFGSACFVDKNKNIWMFGGQYQNNIFYNDLWKYVLDPGCFGSSYCGLSCSLSSPNITAGVTTICPSDSAAICAPQGFATYAWNTTAGGGTGACIEAKQAGDYYVTVTDNTGCSAESNHISISVYSTPQLSISQSGDTLRVYNETNVQWYLNNIAITGATQNTYVAQTHGSYTVSVTDSNGCIAYSLPIIYTGVDNIYEDENVLIYPNPLQVGSWKLEVGSNLLGAQVEILDDNGRVVYKSQIRNLHSEIDAPVAGGVYLLRVVSGTNVIARKLVKL